MEKQRSLKDHEAVLNIEFLNKKLKAGIEMQNKEV